MEDNPEELQKAIEQRIDELPQNVREAILSADFGEKINAISTAEKLHIDQVQELSDNTMMVMLGFMNETEYRNEITALVKGDTNTAEKIINAVNSQIFLSIRESMKNVVAEQSTPTLQSASPVASASIPTPAPAVPAIQTVDMHPADLMLTQKTVVTPPAAPTPTPSTPSAPAQKPAAQNAVPPKPQEYKADPYREPTN